MPELQDEHHTRIPPQRCQKLIGMNLEVGKKRLKYFDAVVIIPTGISCEVRYEETKAIKDLFQVF